VCPLESAAPACWRRRPSSPGTVAQQQADSLLARWAEPPHGSAEEVLRATVDSIFGWIEDHPDGWRILFADNPGDRLVATTLSAVQARASAALAEIFAALPELDHPEGLRRQRADAALAEASKSAVNGLAAWSLLATTSRRLRARRELRHRLHDGLRYRLNAGSAASSASIT
jgi:hypothetical protein